MMNHQFSSYFMYMTCLLLALGQFTFPCLAFSLHRSSVSRSQHSSLELFGGVLGKQETSGPPVIIDIPAKNVKVGALRFLMQIYLVGIQNEPAPKSWLTKQGGDGDLQVYFKDGTAMVSIDFQENGVKVRRFGDAPSLQYMLQESVLLHGILDELNNVAVEVDDIEQEKRLLQLNEPDDIQKARFKLPARKA
ncbi:hypothetical protein FisN_22Lh191 [Fistulifera solaris]|uniref:Uncharacterized protein n=1 Tax=Fistulifera solaris TaxID=1519565 RepID=A0A1Z5JCJ6_FISSO|nr:hypothetical protein FisN_22Lh191 [Fistulifera solaris]|eukprot:GAX11498.1 hypothetical protein FisN_22Lh191 [Fistulifera solaris]